MLVGSIMPIMWNYSILVTKIPATVQILMSQSIMPKDWKLLAEVNSSDGSTAYNWNVDAKVDGQYMIRMLGNKKDPEKRPCFSDGEPKEGMGLYIFLVSH
jgi:hypothetical protein